MNAAPPAPLRVPSALVMTVVVVSTVALALAAILTLPASTLKPVRAWPVDLDEPAAVAPPAASH